MNELCSLCRAIPQFMHYDLFGQRISKAAILTRLAGARTLADHVPNTNTTRSLQTVQRSGGHYQMTSGLEGAFPRRPQPVISL